MCVTMGNTMRHIQSVSEFENSFSVGDPKQTTVGLSFAPVQIVMINKLGNPYFPGFLSYERLREVSLTFPRINTHHENCLHLFPVPDLVLIYPQKHFKDPYGGIVPYVSNRQNVWVNVEYQTALSQKLMS